MKTINPLETSKVKVLLRNNAKDGEYVTSGEYSHFYMVDANGYTIGFSRNQGSWNEIARPVIWMKSEDADFVRQTLISVAKNEYK